MTTSKFQNDKSSPIAFFDSGIGGLTVLNKVKKLLPNENLIYYGDTIHMPYGEKSKDELLLYSDNIFKFFEQKGAKAVVMACNTTSSVIYEDVKDKYNFKLYPIVQSVSKILASLDISNLGVFATRATINSKAYDIEIAKYNEDINVFGQYCPKWVHIVEEGTKFLPENIDIIKSDLDIMLKNKPDKIVLGCTHYPFLIDVLSKFVSEDLFIDPALDFAKYIKSDLDELNLLNDKPHMLDEFYVSSNPDLFMQSSKMFYELSKEPNLLVF